MKKVTRVIASILILTMLLGNYAPMMQTVYAAQIIEEQKQELLDSFDSLLKDLPISDNFIYSDVSDEWVSIYKYIGSEKTVSIPDTINGKSVIALAQDTFADNEEIECVIIPASVVSIGDDAFSGCKSLNKMVLCGTEIELGLTLAGECENLESIYLSNEFDSSTLESILLSDLGEEKAKDVNIIPCENVDDVIILFVTPTDIQKSDIMGPVAPDNNSEDTKSVSNDTLDDVASVVEPSDLEQQPKSNESDESVTSKESEQVAENVKENTEMKKSVEIPTRSVQSDSEDFVIEDGVLTQYKGNGGVVKIPDGVIEIGEGVFKNNNDITEIVLPEGLNKIGNEAFYRCMGLQGNLKLPDGITLIGKSAFNYCRGLTGSLVIPDSVISIGEDAFYYCEGFTGTLKISDNITTIAGGTFFYCTGFTGNLKIPDGVTSIGNRAFSGCAGFTGRLTIPNSVTSIDFDAFSNCSGFYGSLVLPSELTILGRNAFSGCSSLTGNIIIPEKITTIDWYAFANCSGVGRVVFQSKTVPSVGAGVFNEMSALKKIYVPDDAYDAYVAILADRVGQASIEMITNMPLELEEFVISDGVLIEYNGEGGVVEIPDGVTEIAKYVFKGNKSITHIVFPDGLKSIGNLSFKECSGLIGELIIPNSVTSIGASAFYGCYNLSGELVIPNSVTYIGESAFENCSGFSGNLKIPKSLDSINRYTFEGCNSIDKIYFEKNSVPEIDMSAFIYMRSLHAVYVPDESFEAYNSAIGSSFGNNVLFKKVSDIKLIQSNGFVIQDGLLLEYNGSNNVINIPSDVTAIGQSVFENNQSITHVVLPENLTFIGKKAFSNCTSLSGSLDIPSGVTYVMSQAFYNCLNLTGTLTFCGEYEEIGSKAFKNCAGLERVVFEKRAPDMRCYWNSFTGMSSLKEVYVPDEDYEIMLFNDECSYLFGITVKLKKLKTLTLDENSDFRIENGVLVVYGGEGGIVEIPNFVTEIGETAFSYCEDLTDVIIPDSVITIGDSAFNGCKGLTSITIPRYVTAIGECAFCGCTGLTSITIPVSVTSIGYAAFFRCSNLADVYYTSSQENWNKISISNGNTPLTNATIHYNYTPNGSVIDSGKCGDNITYTLYENGLLELNGSGDMYDYNNSTPWNSNRNQIKEVQFIGNITSIGNSAFYYCQSLTGITIPNSVTSIGVDALYGCKGLSTINIPDSVTEIEKGAFSFCEGLTNVSIPNSVTSIARGSFYGCSGLTSVSLSNSVTSIGSNAFLNCRSLVAVGMSDSIVTIDEGAFQNCNCELPDFLTLEPLESPK